MKINGLQKPAPEWKLFAEKVAMHMGIAKKVRLWVSSHVDVPATIGFIKPVILIPLASINQLSADQMEAIILHELCHIRRNDYLINLMVSIIETILFFNPFVVLLSRVIKRERENCCDDFVIQYQYDRHAYASALLSLEQYRNFDLRLAIGSTAGKKQLLQRIKRIMEINQHTNFNYGQKLVALLLITGVISLVAWLSPPNNAQKKEQAKTMIHKRYGAPDQHGVKGEVMRVTATNNASEKGTPVMIQSKRSSLQNSAELKEFSRLTLQETAQREDQRLNLLLQESKKEVGKRSVRLLANRFFMAGRAPYRPTLSELNNQLEMISGKLSDGGKALQKFVFNIPDLKKLQAELDNARLSYSFNWAKMQEDIERAVNWKERQQSRYPIENKKASSTEKISGKEATPPDQRMMTHVIINSPEIRSGSVPGSVFYLDSASLEINNLKERILHGVRAIRKVVVVKDNAIAGPAPFANGYAFGYQQEAGNDDKENRSSTSGKKFFRRIPAGKSLPANSLGIDNNDSEAQAAPPKAKSNRNKATVSVEYKSGKLYINGKLVNLPGTEETLTQFSIIRQNKIAFDKQLELIIND